MMDHAKAYQEGPKPALFVRDLEGEVLTFTRRKGGEYRRRGTHGDILYAGRATAHNPPLGTRPGPHQGRARKGHLTGLYGLWYTDQEREIQNGGRYRGS